MDEGTTRPHRPLLHADLTALIDAAGGDAPHTRAEMATATAQVLLAAGRADAQRYRLVELADSIGIDTLAELWRECDPVSLPGALWVLYLMRQWCCSRPEEVARLWRAGEAAAPADAVVAGVGWYADPDAVRRFADAVLGGVYGGDLAVALDRAAAFFRIIAAGRRASARDDDAAVERRMAARNERTARDLAAAATAWRVGELH